jgi:hypothetical protein
MPLIDDQGRLFGRINVIDALVVLFVLAVATAGVALLAGPSQPEDTSPAYTTLTVGPVSEDAATALTTTNNITLTGSETTLNLTDTHVTPHPNTDAALAIIRVNSTRRTLSQINSELAIETGQYNYNATITAAGNSTTLTEENTSVLLATTVPTETIKSMQPGDTHTIGPETTATVKDIYQRTVGDNEAQLLVGVTLQTLQDGNRARYAGQALRLGTTVPLRTETYTLTGTILNRTTDTVPTQTRTVQIETTVSRSVASNVQAGDTFSSETGTIATIDSVASYPTNDPNRRLLQLNLSLETVAFNGHPEFLNRQLQIGTSIPFRTESYSFAGQITSFGDGRTGEPVDATLEVEWSNVPPRLVDGLSVGQTEQHRGADARITNIQTEPATVILESDDGRIYAREHPVNKDVTLTLDVTATNTDEGLSFHGQQAQRGSTVTLDFGTLSVDGTLITLEED